MDGKVRDDGLLCGHAWARRRGGGPSPWKARLCAAVLAAVVASSMVAAGAARAAGDRPPAAAVPTRAATPPSGHSPGGEGMMGAQGVRDADALGLFSELDFAFLAGGGGLLALLALVLRSITAGPRPPAQKRPARDSQRPGRVLAK
jgi:hypothetical protein